MDQSFKTGTLAKQITVKSAVNPSLWACVVISLPLFVMSIETIGFLHIAFFVVGLLPIISFVVSYIYLLFKNPNYLRSEEYQLKADALKYFGDKDNPMNATPEDIINIITNPELPLLLNEQSENKQLLKIEKNNE